MTVSGSVGQDAELQATRRRVLVRTALVAILVLALDQITKHTLGTSVGPGQEKTVIPGLLHIQYVRNSGVAFGALSGAGNLVYVVIVVALGALVAYMVRRPAKPWVWLPTGMLIGGAIGNLIDRIVRGDVIDFLKLPHWPTFNVADISISCGVIILVFVLEFSDRQEKAETEKELADDEVS